MSNECEHKWDDGEVYKGPHSFGYGTIAYEYTCELCGEVMTIEKDVS